MEAVTITQITPSELEDLIEKVIIKVLSGKIEKKDTYISRLDLARGNWVGGFRMTPPTQDKYRREGLLKPLRIGAKIFYLESDLLSFGGKIKKAE